MKTWQGLTKKHTRLKNSVTQRNGKSESERFDEVPATKRSTLTRHWSHLHIALIQFTLIRHQDNYCITMSIELAIPINQKHQVPRISQCIGKPIKYTPHQLFGKQSSVKTMIANCQPVVRFSCPARVRVDTERWLSLQQCFYYNLTSSQY